MLNVSKTIPLFVVLALSGCDITEATNLVTNNAQLKAEGHAIGSACRHAGRAIEDCYTLNPTALKASVFDGWKQMNDYMAENKIAEVVPVIPRPEPPKKEKKPKKAADPDAEELAPNPEEEADAPAQDKHSSKQN